MKKGMASRSLRLRWGESAPTLGVWCMSSDPFIAEAVTQVGFDFVCIDMQHGLLDFQAVTHLLQVAELNDIAPVVRVPWNEPSIIGRVLDAGAMTVIVPMVNSAVEARAAVTAAHYAPKGLRSFGPTGISLREGDHYLSSASATIGVVVMVETVAGLEAVDDIAGTVGVDGVFVGPYDLSLSLGLAPGDNDGVPIFDEALAKILASCRKHHIQAGILSNPKLAASRVRQGFNMVSIAIDVPTIAQSMAESLKHVKAQIT